MPTVGRTRLAWALAAAEGHADADLAALVRWLEIPSVSGPTGRPGDLVAAARWLAARMRRLGARVQLVPAGGAPVVVAEVAGPPGGRTVLVYGHYDVRPPGTGWSSDPFGPVVRGGVLYGRGTNDDKGQLYAHVAALAAWVRTGGPPVRVVVVAEGAEEIGSPGLAGALDGIRHRLPRPDVVIVSDTERTPGGAPSIVVSQRGAIAADVRVRTGGRPVHAGRFGGAVVDPTAVMVGLLRSASAIVCAVPPAPAGRDATPRSDATVRRLAGERSAPGRDLDARTTLRPALTITAIRAGDPSTAVPTTCRARLDVRLPPEVDPGPVVARLRRLGSGSGAEVDVRVRSAHRGSALALPPTVRRACTAAARIGFGTGPVLLRSGGSIPAVGLLAEAFGRPPVLLGLGGPAGGAHGPDENTDLLGWHRSVRLCAALLETLAENLGVQR